MSTLDSLENKGKNEQIFCVEERVVYPGHGVARINAVIEKVVGGIVTSFFELSFLNKEMTILVPVSSSAIVGLRKLSSKENIDCVFRILSEKRDVLLENSSVNWNRRNKDYQNKLRSGNLYDICKIYRDLKRISFKKELSFGEKSLLSKTESLLIEEISIVNNVGQEKIMRDIRSIFL